MDERLRGSSLSKSSSNYFKLPPLYALIIGINTYISPNWPNLSAATQDADDFERYLTNRLHIPQSNIINLRNEAATRSAILTAFQTLKDLTSIPLKSRHSLTAEEMGIIVFFAGHGTRGEKPKEWRDWMTFDDYYEAICPADMDMKRTDMMGEIPAIPDRTIAALVNQLSEIRGNNITLIFDCCHSAGINRSQTKAEHGGYIPRYISKPPPLPFNYDDGIIGPLSRGVGVVAGQNQSSHVLLAACGREERAYEHPTKSNGVFTYALLKVLNEANVETLTYTSLMHRLKMPVWQNAHCDGVEVNRRLFNPRIEGGDPSLIPSLKVDNHLIMDAGIIQGVTVGTIVEVHISNLYSIQQQPTPPFTTLIVTAVDDNSSTLKLPHSLINLLLHPRRRLYCRIIQRPQTNSHSLSISSNNLNWLESVYTKEFCARHQVIIIRDTNTNTANAADLELRIEDVDDTTQTVFIDHHFPLVVKHLGTTRSPFTIKSTDTEMLHKLVHHAIRFRFHLLHTNPIIPQDGGGGGGGIKVKMDMRQLSERWISESDSVVVEPVGKNVFESDPGRVMVDDDDDDEDEEKTYGVVIENMTDLALYPHLFYFDPSELSITPWYTPPIGPGPSTTSHKINTILPPKSKFSIGYPKDGLNPWSFNIRPGETKDVGFFKLYLTTTPANLNCIVQDSVYSAPGSRVSRSESTTTGRSERDGLGEFEVGKEVVWDTVVMTVVQFKAE